MKITLNNITKSIINKKKKEATLVLYNVSAEFLDKKINVVLGESGAGKTFLLKVIAGIEDIDNGTIYFDNEDVTSIAVAKRNASYLSQNYALYPHLTVFDNVAYPLKLMKIEGDEIRKRVNDILTYLKIHHLQSRKPKELSGGEAQRVALARALVKRPELLLLDESFSNIDKKLTMEFLQLIKDLNATYSTTIIYVTHSLADAWILSDNVVILNNGEVIESGKIKDLYENKNSFLYHNFIKPGDNNVS